MASLWARAVVGFRVSEKITVSSVFWGFGLWALGFWGFGV